MNFYPFHIGDYVSHTSHLSDEEDLAYRRMIDLYYMNEQPLNGSSAIARRIRLSVEIVESVLQEFFEFSDDSCWHNKRIDEEIAKYHNRQTQASKAGKASVKARLNKRTTAVQPTKNQEPITKNQIKTLQAPEGVSVEVWNDFVSQRKKSRAVISENVIKSISREAQKAGWSLEQALAECAARGWRGFKAEWVKESKKPDVVNVLTRGLISGGSNVNLLGK
jgi:uncharacterized protein YdaU (DUF1376 family)